MLALLCNCLQHAAKNFTSEALSAFAGNLHGEVCEDRADHYHSLFVAHRADTCEVLTVLEALYADPACFAERDVMWFIDNDAAWTSLMRGASRQEEVNEIMAIAFWRL